MINRTSATTIWKIAIAPAIWYNIHTKRGATDERLALVNYLKAAATFATGRLLFLCLDYFQQQWYDDCKNHQYNAQEFKITHKLSPLSAKIFLGFCVIGGYRPSGEGQPSTVYGDTLICIVHLFAIKRKCFVKILLRLPA